MLTEGPPLGVGRVVACGAFVRRVVHRVRDGVVKVFVIIDGPLLVRSVVFGAPAVARADGVGKIHDATAISFLLDSRVDGGELSGATRALVILHGGGEVGVGGR